MTEVQSKHNFYNQASLDCAAGSVALLPTIKDHGLRLDNYSTMDPTIESSNCDNRVIWVSVKWYDIEPLSCCGVVGCCSENTAVLMEPMAETSVGDASAQLEVVQDAVQHWEKWNAQPAAFPYSSSHCRLLG